MGNQHHLKNSVIHLFNSGWTMHEQYDISEILSITVCSVYWWQLNTGIVDQFGMATPPSAIHGQWSQFQTFRVAKVILLLVTQWGGTVLVSNWSASILFGIRISFGFGNCCNLLTQDQTFEQWERIFYTQADLWGSSYVQHTGWDVWGEVPATALALASSIRKMWLSLLPGTTVNSLHKLKCMTRLMQRDILHLINILLSCKSRNV